MKSRVLVSIIGLPVMIVIFLWAPAWTLAASLALLTAVAAFELTRCVGAEQPLRIMAVAGAVVSVLDVWLGFPDGQVLPALFVLSAFAYGVFRGGKVKFSHICAALLAILALPYAFSAFLRIFYAGLHRGFLLLPLAFSFACDTCAFFAGRAFGKHPLAPHVSPHKTVEGAVGGFTGDALAGLVFALIMDLACGIHLNYLGMAMLGLLCGAVAQLGDLSFSLIKREFGVKDYGKILLEHGGILDRFDSVIFVAPVLALFLIKFYG